ncbi:hypothetical protein GWI33_017910 [Rhynchophorus ferrugineus]|uniref:Uncharacterized protein n=1 Tax=Rhynchophorus ferrugineus TaxID=354439 RepID=A0A834HUZ0_RHYFE|nr:hypothetical protein GWI33_017910 [Rhynchophorus ferrugineus]
MKVEKKRIKRSDTAKLTQGKKGEREKEKKSGRSSATGYGGRIDDSWLNMTYHTMREKMGTMKNINNFLRKKWERSFESDRIYFFVVFFLFSVVLATTDGSLL